jgi:hypothetical protein
MNRAPRLPILGAFAAIYLFWGGTFLAIRYAVADLPPLLTIGLRCAGGAALLYAWLGVRGRLERASLSAWGTSALAGALLFLACHGVMASVEQRVSSGETALWMTAIPLWRWSSTCPGAARPPLGGGRPDLGRRGGGVSAGDGSTPSARDHAALPLRPAWARPRGRHGPGRCPPSSRRRCSPDRSGSSPRRARPEPWSGLRLTAGANAGVPHRAEPRSPAAYTWLLRVTTPAVGPTPRHPLIALLLGWAVGDDTLGARTVLATGLVVSAVLVTQWRGLLGPKRSAVPARKPGRALPTTAPRPPESDLRGTGWLRLS